MSAKDLYFLGGISSESSSREELLFSDVEDDEFDKFCVVVEALGDALELNLVSSFGETSTVIFCCSCSLLQSQLTFSLNITSFLTKIFSLRRLYNLYVFD